MDLDEMHGIKFYLYTLIFYYYFVQVYIYTVYLFRLDDGSEKIKRKKQVYVGWSTRPELNCLFFDFDDDDAIICM